VNIKLTKSKILIRTAKIKPYKKSMVLFAKMKPRENYKC
jgi:hypothetical protein